MPMAVKWLAGTVTNVAEVDAPLFVLKMHASRATNDPRTFT
jgi:hypothetical protein